MAGHKTWAVGEEVIASDFGPYVGDQIVAVFASAAARTSGWPSPPVGAASYRIDGKRVEVFNGTAWVAPGAAGLLARIETNGSPGSLSATEADMPGLALPALTVPDGRIVQFAAWGSAMAGGQGSWELIITDSANVQLVVASAPIITGNATAPALHATVLARRTLTTPFAPTFTTTFKVRARMNWGTAGTFLSQGNIRPFLEVVDLGPA